LSQEETSEKEEKDAMLAVVAGHHRRKVVPRTRQPAVAEGVTPLPAPTCWFSSAAKTPATYVSTTVVDDREPKTVAIVVPADIAEVEEAPLIDKVYV
jgi:hypothetical protein